MTLFGDEWTYRWISIAILSYFCAGFLQDLKLRKVVFYSKEQGQIRNKNR